MSANYRGRGGRPRRERTDARRERTEPRRTDTHHDRTDPHRIRYLSWKDITTLAASASEDVVKAILSNEAGFLKVFSHDESCKNPRILKSLIKILHTLVKSQENELAARILGQIYCGDGACAQFCFQVDRLLRSIPNEPPQYSVQNHNYLLYLFEIGLFGILRIPTTMLESFPLASLISTTEALRSHGQDVRILLRKCEELRNQFDLAREQRDCKPTTTKQAVPNGDDELEPPNDFTSIEILPHNEDLISEGKRKPFLRRNIIKGGYKGWDHYLDVQFRLLREDFIAPLREGIYEGFSDRNSQVRVYEDVHVLTPVCLFTGMGFQISFSVRRFTNTKWEHSRRLIFGSLLCLSNQNFRDDSIIFATVVKREPEQLREGCLIVKFEGCTSGFNIDPADSFTMVESTAYFEAYRHILVGLQNISLVKDTMPFTRYLVDCKLKDIQLPWHVRRSTFIDLSSVLCVKSNEARHIDIKDESTWPHVQSVISLDESQYKALKMALRKEISVIQGPPGTGKTFIGLKLVQAFLHNRICWDPEKNSPILVVCYTNHALDQFLEDIVKVYAESKLTPPDIVRIGGRCKSATLSNFVLAHKVRDVREDRSLPMHLYRERKDLLQEMYTQKVHFKTLEQQMDQAEGKILPLSALQSVITDDHYFQLSQGMPTEGGKEIEVWLKLWNPTSDDLTQEMEAENEETNPQQVLVPAIENTEDELIDVDKEAEILQDERMLEGEQIINEDVPAIENTEDELIDVDKEAEILQDERMLEGEQIINEDVPVFEDHEVVRPKKKETQSEWQTVQISDKERSKRIRRGFQHKPMKSKDAIKVGDVRFLENEKRWKLYHYWATQYLRNQKEEMVHPAEHYNAICTNYSRVKEEIDCYVARGADIIGMTTTGAAKHHHILKNIRPKIVVIEEAAEVFESHVITSLSPSVQQLILIGDHKQLRPKPNCYELEKKYNFDVSLFERLIVNGIPYVSLTKQHRMRPDIASLICPAIYSHLENGGKAIKHGMENIRGIGHNLFFIDHTEPERHQDPNESLSHVNIHEANYMVALCRYLLKQGYTQTQITLLTMYKGQLLQMRQRMTRTEFEGVRVAAVDDFQGEENDIILLSLVRSNSDGHIGFLRIENRVCVALSRARKGLYVIGNFSMLRNCDKTIWPQILSVVDEKRCIGDALVLQCQIHPQQMVRAKVPGDFSKCPEGGCTKPCNVRLNCGHVCPRLCHPWDREHKRYKCQKRCVKILPCRHRCKRNCYDCINGCAPCIEVVEKQLPACGHSMVIQCQTDPSKVLCTKQCIKELGCGHQCQKLCSEQCDYRCSVKVETSLPCGHKVKKACYLKVESIECPVPCNTLLQCEHECAGNCGRCQQGRLHIHCESKCGRTLVCGHICNSPCAAECPPCTQKCSNYCSHSKCPKKCYEPCDPCAEPCMWNCRHLQCTKRCGEQCNRPRCNMPCRKRLAKCGHPCIGLCGDECPTLCGICDRDDVVEVFFGTEDEPDAMFVQLRDCGHIFEYSGLDQWMDQQEEQKVIQFKKCPKCSTLIRTSLRYYNEIKRIHDDFEEIKKRQLQVSDIASFLATLRDLRRKYPCKETQFDINKIESLLSSTSNPQYTLPHCLSAIQNQLAILPHIAKMYAKVKQKSCLFGDCKVTTEALHRDLDHVKTFLMQDSLTDQQLNDIQCEMKRLDCMFRLCELHSRIEERRITINPQERSALDILASKVYYSGAGKKPKMSDDLEKEVSVLIASFREQYDLEDLTDSERVEINKGMDFSKGHWFKCPYGHIYCIGDCGGAIHESHCPECDARIGGASHTLRTDNQLASEMDGARHGAWSETANMENYDLQLPF